MIEIIRSKLFSLRDKCPDLVFTRKELIRRLEVEFEFRHLLAEILREMEKSGLLHRLKRNKYAFSSAGQTTIGRLEVHRHGFGFVRPENGILEDIYISPHAMAHAVHGDQVVVSVEQRVTARRHSLPKHRRRKSRRKDRAGEGLEDSANRSFGRVVQVLERVNQRIVGRVFFNRNSVFVQPLDERLLFEIHLPEVDRSQLQEGTVTEVEVVIQPARHRPAVGRLRSVIGNPGDKDLPIKVTLCKFGIPQEFSDSALAEANSLPTEIEPGLVSSRRDFRGWPTVTIDGETARDFDDAVTLEKDSHGFFRLGVHIADVSSYVREGSALDAEAYLRGNSVYFPDRAIPMLPIQLSNGTCSLNPGVDRLVFSVLMRVSPEGQVHSYEIVPGIICSDARMTYTSVAKILLEQDVEESRRYEALVPLFENMKKLCEVLTGQRRIRGAIDLNLPEEEIQLSEQGDVVTVVPSERNVAHRIIEEFMLLANETVAGFLERHRQAALYRIHEDPDPERVREFKETINLFGYRLEMSGDTYSPRDFQHISDWILKKHSSYFLCYLMLRSFMQARYSEVNTGHFGLACSQYTHFTSPIRRYADLVVHRLVRKALEEPHGTVPIERPKTEKEPLSPLEVRSRESKGRGKLRLDENTERLRTIAIHVSNREQVAKKAEREMLDYYKARLMSRHVGDEFKGIISHVVNSGFFVQIEKPYVEGYLPATFLEDDYYVYRKDIRSLVGRFSKAMFRLGDQVAVRVNSVDLDARRISFSLAD